MTVTVTAYELSEDETVVGNHYYEIEQVTFGDEADAMEWADAMGFLDSDNHSISLEDENGTLTYL